MNGLDWTWARQIYSLSILPGANTGSGGREEAGAGARLADWRGRDLGARDRGAGTEAGLLDCTALALASCGLQPTQTKLACGAKDWLTHRLWKKAEQILQMMWRGSFIKLVLTFIFLLILKSGRTLSLPFSCAESASDRWAQSTAASHSADWWPGLYPDLVTAADLALRAQFWRRVRWWAESGHWSQSRHRAAPAQSSSRWKCLHELFYC